MSLSCTRMIVNRRLLMKICPVACISEQRRHLRAWKEDHAPDPKDKTAASGASNTSQLVIQKYHVLQKELAQVTLKCHIDRTNLINAD